MPFFLTSPAALSRLPACPRTLPGCHFHRNPFKCTLHPFPRLIHPSHWSSSSFYLYPLFLSLPQSHSRDPRNIRFPSLAMGSCISYDSTTVAPVTTAKLILPDGELREFAWPIKASHAIQKESDCFVCDADDMEFGGFVSAIPADEELRPGQIYFVLPRSMLRHPMQAEDLVALAVKASSALMKAAPGGDRSLLFTEARSPAESPSVAVRWMRSGENRRSFETNLTAIPE